MPNGNRRMKKKNITFRHDDTREADQKLDTIASQLGIILFFNIRRIMAQKEDGVSVWVVDMALLV